MDRSKLIQSMFDSSGFGLEVGPSYNPLLPKRQGYNVETVDHATGDELREKYTKIGGVDVGNIEDVDYVSDGGSLVDLIGQTGRYDFIFASHVIEHVTDVIRFLSDCEQLLKPDGVLVLAVPDKRFCFDVLRPVSTVGSAIQAYLDKPTRHPPGMVFDHSSLAAAKFGQGVWLESSLEGVDFIGSVAAAKDALDSARVNAEYVDIHRWQFTPSYFRYFIQILFEIGMIGLKEVRFHKNQVADLHMHEFYISLSRTGAGSGSTSIELMKQAQGEMREIVVSASETDVPQDLRLAFLIDELMKARAASVSGQMPEQLAAALEKVSASEVELERLAGEVARLEAEATEVRNSMSWRMTSPFRRIRAAVRR